jgi:hypothetical protein
MLMNSLMRTGERMRRPIIIGSATLQGFFEPYRQRTKAQAGQVANDPHQRLCEREKSTKKKKLKKKPTAPNAA